MNENEVKGVLREIREVLKPDLQESGAVFYSGPESLMDSRPYYYLMGLNPGGSPTKLESIETALDEWEKKIKLGQPWSQYINEVWSDDEDPTKAGKKQHQVNIQHLCKVVLQRDTNSVFSANAIFRRGDPNTFGNDVRSRCWMIHTLLLKQLQPKALWCLGNDSASSFELVKKWLQENAQAMKPFEECGLKGEKRVFIRWFDSHSSISMLDRDKPLRIIGLPHPSHHWYEQLPGIKEKVSTLIAEL